MKRSPTTLDLFCGAGGITEGFRRRGFRCVFANDTDTDAVATFKRNHSQTEVTSSPIQELDPKRIRTELNLRKGELDCLVGGPPCQGFSINAPERFLDDPRNNLFKHYLSFVKEFKPKTIMFENVPGILSLANGRVAERIVLELKSLGYSVGAKILCSAHYGVPQERWRLILLASRKGYPPRFPEPTHFANGRANFTGGKNLIFKLVEDHREGLDNFISVYEAIGDLPPLASGEGFEEMEYSSRPHSDYARDMRRGASMVRHHVSAKIADINLKRLRFIPPGGSWRDIPHDYLPDGMKRARRSDHTKRYGRLSPDGLASTVMTKMDPHWGPAFHYEQDRTLTVREAARLQAFPDTYIFSGTRGSQYRQIGNAVPVLMAEAVANMILDALTQFRPKPI